MTFNKVAPLPEDFIKPIDVYVKVDGEIPMPARKLMVQSSNPSIFQDLPSILDMKIGDCIGSGRSSRVFDAEPLSPDSRLPPLVAKFGIPGFNKFILREAWFYEEMQTLQGKVIPQCYGLYYARIPRGTAAFIPWLRGESRTLWKDIIPELDKYISNEELLVRFIEKCARGKSSEDLARDESTLNFIGNFNEKYAEIVHQLDDFGFDFDRHDIVVPVIILEKLGKPYLPLGGKNWPMLKPIPENVECVDNLALTV